MSIVRAAMTQTVNAYPDMPETVKDLRRLKRRLDAVRGANVEHNVGLIKVAAKAGAKVVCLGELCTGPNFAMMVARTGLRGGTVAWFYLTEDRAHTWQGPYSLPMFGQTGIEARTDYIINGPQDAMIFVTATTEEGEEGKGVLMARTTDGGKNFNLVSWVGTSVEDELIMPGSVRVDENTILTAIRCSVREGEFEDVPTWIDLYESTDNGTTFHYLNRPVPDAGSGGNPPALTKLQDGRICLVHGYRNAPFGIRARLSEDNGKTWGEVIHLRDDGTASDLGYPRTVQRPDGTLVTTYYYNDHPDTERFIAATLWKP